MRGKNGYIKAGVTVFCTAAAILLFYDTLFGGKMIQKVGGQLLRALLPVIYGAFIAYLLAPMVNFFENNFFSGAVKRAQERGRLSSGGVRAMSLLLTWLIICAAAYLLASVLLPELYRSVIQLIGNIENYYNTISGWVEHLLETNPALEEWVAAQMDLYFESAKSWFTTKLLPQATMLMGVVSGSVVGIVAFCSDLLVGIIVSIYFMATKERCAAHARKVVCGLCSRENARWVFRGARKVDRIFSGFVRGKLLDSLIIGVICFVGCSILNFPYTPLVSVFVGVTNVIPFFGPFLGAIPSTILILLASPRKALYFVLFVLALQQLDGNFIGPKILGDKTGLPSLWVITAILVGGSFFGLAGMFFGVPVCACLYSAVNFFLEVRLRKKNLPRETEAYITDQPVSPAQKDAEHRGNF